jgi:hypothetical protein
LEFKKKIKTATLYPAKSKTKQTTVKARPQTAHQKLSSAKNKKPAQPELEIPSHLLVKYKSNSLDDLNSTIESVLSDKPAAFEHLSSPKLRKMGKSRSPSAEKSKSNVHKQAGSKVKPTIKPYYSDPILNSPNRYRDLKRNESLSRDLSDLRLKYEDELDSLKANFNRSYDSNDSLAAFQDQPQRSRFSKSILKHSIGPAKSKNFMSRLELIKVSKTKSYYSARLLFIF